MTERVKAFLWGVASSYDILGSEATDPVLNESTIEQAAEELNKDWNTIGNDMRKAITKYGKTKKEVLQTNPRKAEQSSYANA